MLNLGGNYLRPEGVRRLAAAGERGKAAPGALACAVRESGSDATGAPPAALCAVNGSLCEANGSNEACKARWAYTDTDKHAGVLGDMGRLLILTLAATRLLVLNSAGSLTHLDLSSNSIRDEGVGRIVDVLVQCKSLAHLCKIWTLAGARSETWVRGGLRGCWGNAGRSLVWICAATQSEMREWSCLKPLT